MGRMSSVVSTVACTSLTLAGLRTHVNLCDTLYDELPPLGNSLLLHWMIHGYGSKALTARASY